MKPIAMSPTKAIKISSILISLSLVSLSIMVSSAPTSIKHMYDQLFATQGTPMSVEQTLSILETVDKHFRFNSKFDMSRFSDLHRKLKPLLESPSTSYSPENVHPCISLIDLENSPLNQYINLMPLVGARIETFESLCRDQLGSFVKRLANEIHYSTVWSSFKSSVKEQLNASDNKFRSRNYIDNSYRKAFDKIVSNIDNPLFARDMDRGFQDYYGASSDPITKVRQEMFGAFRPEYCDHVSFIHIVLAMDPTKYIGNNPTERDVVDRLFAYCILKDYSVTHLDMGASSSDMQLVPHGSSQ